MLSAGPISFSSPNVQGKTTPKWKKRSAATTATPPSTPAAITHFISKISLQENACPYLIFVAFVSAPLQESLFRKVSSKA
jgi:hypothetical protein